MKKDGNRLEGIGERIAVRLTLLEEALGMTPGDPEIYGNWIASKAPEPENGAEEVGVIEGMEAVEDATTCFPRTEDGVPFCWDYQIKGFFKDACSSLRRVPGTRSSKLTAFKKVIGGTRALSRSGGKDTAPASGIDFSSGSKELRLKVSKLDRKINAALMDKASSGGTDMLKLGFKFSEKALQGVVSISGDTTVGSTLTETTSNLQADAKPSYQWYRDGSAIPGATGGTYTTVEADAGHEIICKVTDSSGRYSGVLTSNVITPVQPEPVAFAVFSADDSSLNFYKRPNVPEAGTRFEGKTATEVYTGIETNRWFGYERPWDSRSASIWSTKVVDVIQPEYTTSWFKDCSNLISVDLRKLDTSNVKKMDQMFWDCSSLRTLDVSGFNTGNVDTMASMFHGCSNLV